MTALSTRPELGFIPPLENGDCLTADEFMRRYEAMPDVKAELIEGVVYLSSPVSRRHGIPHLHLGGWLVTYLALHPELEGGDDTTVVLEGDSIPQPDLYLRTRPSGADAAATFVEGAPELVIEISATTASIDLHQKKDTYRRNGVQEYLVWRTVDEKVDWFVLERGEYVALAPDAGGVLESRVFPGLRLDVSALLAGDVAKLLAGVSGGAG